MTSEDSLEKPYLEGKLQVEGTSATKSQKKKKKSAQKK